MDNPRDDFLRLLRTKPDTQIDTMEDACIDIRKHIIHTLFYVIIDYIKYEREINETGFGPIEQSYFCTHAFMHAEDARKWIDENVPEDDMDLIMYVFDHPYKMERSKHRRMLLYLTNMLYFDL